MTTNIREDLPRVMRLGKYLEGLVDLCDWAKENTEGNIAIEIGSYLGESAEIISQYYKVLWCIDPWGMDFQGIPAKDIFLKRFPGVFSLEGSITGRGNIVYAKEGTSPLAATNFNDVDFVYIDGNHGYAEVKADIQAWLPKVKHGVIAGHDYDPVIQPGVVKAVDEVLGKPANIFVDTSWSFKIDSGKLL